LQLGTASGTDLSSRWRLTSRALLANFLQRGVMRSGFKFLLGALLISVMALFFCPLAFGSFQSTHGPTSTLDAGSVSLDFTIAFIGMVLPSLVLRPLCRLEFEAEVESAAGIHPLRVLLCTFRC